MSANPTTPRKPHLSLSNIKTQPKVLMAVAVPLLLILGLGVVSVWNLNRMAYTQGWVDHTQRVLNKGDRIVGAAVDMETGMRGFLLAGQEQFLEPYVSGAERAFSGLEDLRITVSDNPGQVQRLTEVEATLRNWQTEIAEAQIDLRREIGDAATMNDMSAEVRKGAGKAYFDTFRGKIAEFIAKEEALLEKRQAEFDQLVRAGSVNASATQDALDWVNHTYKVIIQAKDILAAAVDMETGMRGYLLAGDEVFLEPYDAGRSLLNDRVDVLAATVSDNPPQVALIEEARKVINDWDADVVGPMIKMRRDIGDAKTMDDMADLIGEARGKTFFDGFRALMNDFAAEERALMEARSAANEKTAQTTQTLIVATVIVAFLIGGALAWLIGSNIGAAIRTLTASMRRLADGDNAVTINGQTRGDELGDMARATEVFKQNAIRVAKLNEERAADAKRMEALAQEREKASAREIELAREKEETDRKAQTEREQMMAELDQAIGTVVEHAICGQFASRVEMQFADDTLDSLAQKLNRLMEVVEQGVMEAGEVLGHVAKGDLRREMTGDFQGAFAELQSDVNGMIMSLNALMAEFANSSENLSASSAELSGTAHQLSQKTENNAASLEEAAAALEQISASVKNLDELVQSASSKTKNARSNASTSETVAAEAAASMEEIAEASKEIEKAVSVIEDITFQINLLALNAGVEAARAGEAGRGFSVVASEVRALAQRSGEATKEIGQVIERSNNAVSTGVEKVEAAKKSLDMIISDVVDIASSVDSASTAISEQRSGIEEVNDAVANVDSNMQMQAAAFEEITGASTQLANEAKKMETSVSQFQRGSEAQPASNHDTTGRSPEPASAAG